MLALFSFLRSYQPNMPHTVIFHFFFGHNTICVRQQKINTCYLKGRTEKKEKMCVRFRAEHVICVENLLPSIFFHFHFFFPMYLVFSNILNDAYIYYILCT